MSRFGVVILGASLPLVVATLLAVNPPQARSDPRTAQSTEIKVDNFTFAPETVIVQVNSTVTWVNKDDIPHVIASTDGVFKSKGLDTDDKYSYTFTKPGTYKYYCSIHPKMTGTVVVQ